MTDNEIQIAMAEARGWKKGREISPGEWVWRNPEGGLRGQMCLPNHPHDLNATREAILTLSDIEYLDDDKMVWSERCEFLRQLEIIVTRDTGNTDGRIQFDLVNYNARQGDEAFLRVHGKWK